MKNKFFLLIPFVLLTSCSNLVPIEHSETENESSSVSVSESSSIEETSSESITSESETSSETQSSDYTLVDGVYNDKYYKNVNLNTKAAINASLQTNMFRTHRKYCTYGEIRNEFKFSDADPNKTGNILCFYTRKSMPGAWDQGVTYNREHVWPKANSGGLFTTVTNSDDGAGSDQGRDRSRRGHGQNKGKTCRIL